MTIFKYSNHLKRIIGYSSLIFIGIFIGVSINVDFTIDAKWTDIFASIVTVAGVTLAYVTFIRWVGNKKKDDSYLAAKEYLASLNEIREVVREISFQYSHLSPAPGVLVEEKEVSNERIKQANKLSHQLYLSRVNISNRKNELNFWNVKLSESFKEKHEVFVKDVTNLNVVITGLNSQLYHFYNSSDEDRIKGVLRHKKMFDDNLDSLITFLEARIEMGFENVFIFPS